MSKESIIETIKKQFDATAEILEANDTFDFKCKQCGRCCMHRRDIIINPFDVFNGARYLGITPKEFIENNCYVTLGGNSKIPMVLLESNDKGWCPLLKFDIKDGGTFKCSINPAKPSVCASHPLGTVWSNNLETAEKEKYYIKVDQCPNSLVNPDKQKVSEWMKHEELYKKEYEIAHVMQTYSEQFFNFRKFYWMCTFILNPPTTDTGLPEDMKKSFGTIHDSLMQAFGCAMEAMLAEVYIEYDINRPYIEQAYEHKEKLTSYFENIKKLNDFLVEAFEQSNIDLEEFIKSIEGDE